MKRKNKLILICVVIGLFVIMIMPTEVSDINCAVVNSENGDIAFSYFYDTNGIDSVVIDVYTRDGKQLFSKSYLHAPVQMIYVGEDLCIVVGKGDYKKYCFDREGNEINNTVTMSEIQKRSSFDEWSFSFWSWSSEYSYDNYVYRYERPTVFKHRAVLTVRKGEETVILYQDP